jgi:hypothetical protein
MPAVAEVILILLLVQGKKESRSSGGQKKIKGSSINKQTNTKTATKDVLYCFGNRRASST